MDRRTVLKTLGASAFAWPSLATAAGSTQPFVDAMALLTPNSSNRLLDDIRDSGLHACIVPIGAPTAGGNAGLRRATADLREYLEFIDDHKSHLLVGHTAEDIVRAKASHRIAIFFEIENANVLADDLERLEQLHRLGVRVLQLTHNGRNDVGDGYLEDTNAGLSRFGMDVVSRMNEIGLLVDLSHCGEATTMGALSVTTAPAAITHGACRAVHASPRNKSDDVLKALATRGGVIGIAQARTFLGPESADAMDLYIRHIEHAIDVAGIDHVGVGSDRELRAVPVTAEERRRLVALLAREQNEDDIALPTPWPYFVQALDGPKRMERLAEELAARGRSSTDIDKLLGGNFQRLLRNTLR